MKKINLFFITLMFICFLASCGKTETDDKKYTVSFDSQGGSSVETITVEGYKTAIGELSTPTKHGYNFVGWYPSLQFLDGTKVTSESLIGKDLTLYAKWEPITLNIEIVTNDGTTQSDFNLSIKKAYYDSILNLPYMEKEGYIFTGWFDEANNKLPYSYKVTKDIKIIANYILKSELASEYKINYVLNGGNFYQYNSESELIDDFLTDIDSSAWNETITIDNLISSDRVRLVSRFFYEYWWWEWFLDFLKAEYTELAKDSENEFYAKMIETIDKVKNGEFEYRHPGNSIENRMIKAEVYAMFTNAKYQYEFNGQEVVSLNYKDNAIKQRMWEYIKTEVNTTYIPGKDTPLSTPYYVGHTFEGWYLDSECTQPIEYIDVTNYGDITVYAKWSQN